MKQITITILTASVFTLTACTANHDRVSPTDNEALKKISNSSEPKKEGVLQKNLDKWLKTEWTPTVEKDSTIKKMNADKNRGFTLQEYVDKMVVYSKESNSSGDSLTQKMENMPVIGK